MPAERVCECDMRHQTTPEKRADAALRAVEKLIGHHDVERSVLLLQTAHRTGRQDALDAEDLEAVDIGAEIELRREYAMSGAVARKKGHPLAPQRADHVRAGRLAEGRCDRSLFAVRNFSHVVQPAAADDADLNRL